MTYSIVYASMTGNTALLAEKIRATLPESRCVYFGAPAQEAQQADVIFAGFWTDKGGCSDEIAAFLKSLAGKRVFLFGTAGFGGADAYFQQIIERVAVHLDQSNTAIGSFMCQGKMPQSVRARYAAMEAENPDKARPMLENFDRALSHPDDADLQRFAQMLVDLSLAD